MGGRRSFARRTHITYWPFSPQPVLSEPGEAVLPLPIHSELPVWGSHYLGSRVVIPQSITLSRVLHSVQRQLHGLQVLDNLIRTLHQIGRASCGKESRS